MRNNNNQTKTPMVQVLFNNYDCSFEDYKKSLMESIEDTENREDVSDERVYDYISECEECAWHEMKYELKYYYPGTAIVNANTFSFYGFGGGNGYKFYHNMNLYDIVCDLLADCGRMKVWKENDSIFVEGTHHDGTISAEIKEVTSIGEQMYDNWEWGDRKGRKEYDVMENIFKYFSKKIRL